jgi:integrase
MRLGMLRFWRRLSLCPAIRDITAENFRLFLGAMPIDAEKKRCGYASKVKTQQALISFARFLAREGLTSPQLAESIAAVPFKQVFKPQRTVLTRHRLEEAFALVEDVGKGRTKLDVGLSRCILALTALAGLRRSELIPLQLAHIDFDNSVLWVVDGKGHKTAPVGMQPLLVEELRRWLKLRPQSPRPELLLMRDGRPLTVWAIRGRIRRLSDWLGVPITPHGLRRTFITTLVQSGMDLASVKRNARHNHLAMTELYTMVDEQEAIDALKNFRPAGKEKAPGGAFIEEEVNTILPPAPQPEQEDRWKALERRLEEIDRL